ncbi:MAG: hypothetical protein ACK56F_21475 [bacterium]
MSTTTMESLLLVLNNLERSLITESSVCMQSFPVKTYENSEESSFIAGVASMLFTSASGRQV